LLVCVLAAGVVLHAGCLVFAWWLPGGCLVFAWWLPAGVCLLVAGWLPVGCLVFALWLPQVATSIVQLHGVVLLAGWQLVAC
jgi:hypothetical protein